MRSSWLVAVLGLLAPVLVLPTAPPAAAAAPGRGQGPTETWLRYDGRSTPHAYGGRSLRGVPARSGDGWFSPAFREIWRR